MAEKRILKSFADLVPKGENPHGVTMHEPNGTSRIDTGAGPQDWKWNSQADGPRWNGSDPEPEYPPVAAATQRRRRR